MRDFFYVHQFTLSKKILHFLKYQYLELKIAAMDYLLGNEIQSYLDYKETLLWTGKPKKGILFHKSDLFIFFFSIFWCGFSFFWIYSAYTSGAPIFFVLFGVPFVLVGLYLLVGRFLIDASNRANTV